MHSTLLSYLKTIANADARDARRDARLDELDNNLTLNLSLTLTLLGWEGVLTHLHLCLLGVVKGRLVCAKTNATSVSCH